MLRIRLAQQGTKNRRTYRFVAIEEGKRRNGKPAETLGFYNPLVEPAEMKVDMDRVTYWISVGAQPTPTVKKLLKLS